MTDRSILPITYASIRFVGETLKPIEVTEIMKNPPTFSYSRGDKHVVGKAAVEATRKSGLWLYSTERCVASQNIRDHICDIEERLIGSISIWPGSKARQIANFLLESGYQMDVSLFWHGAYGSTFPYISTSLKTVVAFAGGTFETDFHRDNKKIRSCLINLWL